MDAATIARVCHEANRAYALACGEDPATVWPAWDAAPEEIRESARKGVTAALAGDGPEELHSKWLMQKRNDGWQYGAVRDNVTKRHPCMVPYHELPDAQRRKDALFAGIVDALR